MQRSSWPDLTPDLLRDVSGRLRDAGDFFRFHAVCKPWRESHSRGSIPSFPPWLLAAPEKDSAVSLNFRCIFSKSSYRATPAPPPSASRRIWLSCAADPTAVRYLTVEHLRPSLHDTLTGEVTQLPLFLDGQWEEEEEEEQEKNSRGAICSDGTTLLYSTSLVQASTCIGIGAKFRAVLLHPGDLEWTLIERTLDKPPGRSSEYCAVYRGGKILVTVETNLWHAITLDGGDADDVLVRRMRMPEERTRYSEQYSYILESRGEILWASVEIHKSYYSPPTFSVSVHTLEAETRVRWVKKDGHSLADRVLFLGWPNSFAVDAMVIGGGHGGYAYFVHHKSNASPCEQYGVFKYNLVDNKEIANRLLEARDDLNRQQQINTAPVTRFIDIERKDDPRFKVLVRNLPLTVRSSQLQAFFGNHGKVSSAEVINYKKTKRSQGMGFVTMSTVHAHPDDALDALTDLILDGCKLEVSFVNESRRRRERRSFFLKGGASSQNRYI
uniref:Uncharacterized protein n=1 Tax=Avena sativa TaxID=4498 RepID=A0ACD5XJ21_AVESA